MNSFYYFKFLNSIKGLKALEGAQKPNGNLYFKYEYFQVVRLVSSDALILLRDKLNGLRANCLIDFLFIIECSVPLIFCCHVINLFGKNVA